jgi:hypothetical protein
MDPEPLTLYPELMYRRYQGGTLADDAVLKIPRRGYDPDTFEQLVLDHGFRVIDHWDGCAGAPYGEGPELVVQFTTSGDQPRGHTDVPADLSGRGPPAAGGD